MKYLNVILITAIIFYFGNAFSQETDLRLYEDHSYQIYNSDGEMIDGIKIGKWIDRSNFGTIYREGSYDLNGIPIGKWIINYPSGKLRKETEYSDGKVIRWAKYIEDEIIVEIKCTAGLGDSTFNNIVFLEDLVFAQEGNYSVEDVQPYKFDYILNEDIFEVPNTPEAVPHYLSYLRKDKSESSLIFWYPPDVKCREYHIIDGIVHKKSYNYKNSVLKSVKEYEDYNLKRKIIYNKKGEITKIVEN